MSKSLKNRNRSTNDSGITDSPGIISSILGMFNFGNINVCTANDEGFYCSFMRFFQLFMAIIVLLAILYVLYMFIVSSKSFKMMGGKIRK